jgi:FkbM family methyltransferase
MGDGPRNSEIPNYVAEIRHADKSFYLFQDCEDDHIFRQVKKSGSFYEPTLLQSLGRRLRPGELVLDIGANIGNHTIYFAGVCGCNVVAFEPNPTAARLLRAAVWRNGLTRLVEVREIALGSSKSRGHVDDSLTKGNLGASRVVPTIDGDIQIETLSMQALRGSPRLVKIDAEGAELPILHGGRNLLKKGRTTLAIEAKTLNEYDALVAYLHRYRYVPVETHNYSPTHVLVRSGWANQRSILHSVASQGCRNYVQIAELQSHAEARFKNLEEDMQKLDARLSKLESEIAARNTIQDNF